MRTTAVFSRFKTAFSTAVRGLELLVRGIGFWTAILLPMAYLPPLFLGHPTFTDPVVLGKLLALNVVAIAIGLGYDRNSPVTVSE